MFFFKPKAKDVSPIQDGWTIHQQDEDSTFWFTDKHDACRLQFTGRCSWPFDLSNAEAAKKFYQNQCSELGGALIEIGVENIQGLESLVGVFKYHSPEPGSPAMYYVGIIWIPFEKCTYQINFESLERGTTGAREAAVYLLQDQEPANDTEPVLIESPEELISLISKKKIEVLPSDSVEYDETFPNHPLSKVRFLLNQFKKEASINSKLSSLKPYRNKNA